MNDNPDNEGGEIAQLFLHFVFRLGKGRAEGLGCLCAELWRLSASM